jgi:hypothetical protein
LGTHSWKMAAEINRAVDTRYNQRPAISFWPARFSKVADLCSQAVALVQILIIAASGVGASETGQRWFANDSPWNQRIEDAEPTPYSDGAIQAFEALRKPFNLNWGSAGITLLDSQGPTVVRKTITFTDDNGRQWQFPSVPITTELFASFAYELVEPNTDGMTCIYDREKNGFFSFWKVEPNAATAFTARAGGFSPADGPGWMTLSPSTPSPGRAAGASYCGGLILPSEIAAGKIDHALALAWPKNLILKRNSDMTHVQYPATASDGVGNDPSIAVPMGARLQLDPSLSNSDLHALGLLSSADLAIARALQEYGAYIVDSNAENGVASLYFVNARGNGGQVYGATNPFPPALISRMRFVNPPKRVPLDDAAVIGIPKYDRSN